MSCRRSCSTARSCAPWCRQRQRQGARRPARVWRPVPRSRVGAASWCCFSWGWLNRLAAGYITAPPCQGTNSFSPQPCCSLLVCAPEAVASTCSKMRWPMAAIVVWPSMISPQLMSMSSCCRCHSAELVASLSEGEGGVGLGRGRGRAAVGGAAPGGKADQVGPAGHLAGGADRVVARCVHVDQAVLRDRLGVFVHRLQVAGAALGDRAERFFQDRGQAARLVARRGVVVHLALVDGRVVLPPFD